VAVVTGAGRGIGRAIARRFATEGAAVTCAARTQTELDDTVRAITGDGGRALAVRTDVRDAEAVLALAQQTVERFGKLDLAVLNAGMMLPPTSVERVDPVAWQECLDVNLTGVFLGLRAVVPHLRAAGGGRILVVGAGAARRAPQGLAAYAASKAGVSALVRVAARDLRASGIAVNELQPGPTATALHGVGTDEPDTLVDREVVLEEGLEDDVSIAGEWFKSPRSVADAALFVATLPSRGPTGQIFSLNSVI
jgi:NAD(P)-dependent dehydrogenase (short-subunit alcohol dehydrogenase family)